MTSVSWHGSIKIMTSYQWYGVIIIFIHIFQRINSLFVFMFSYKFISYIEIAIQIETSIFIM